MDSPDVAQPLEASTCNTSTMKPHALHAFPFSAAHVSSFDSIRLPLALFRASSSSFDPSRSPSFFSGQNVPRSTFESQRSDRKPSLGLPIFAGGDAIQGAEASNDVELGQKGTGGVALRGFSITIIHTTLNSLNPSSHPHFTFHSIVDGLSETDTDIANPTRLMSCINAHCYEPFKNCLAKLLCDEGAEEEPIACLITNQLFYFTKSVAESLKLPRLILITGSASSTVVYAKFPLLWEKGYLPKQESQLEEIVAELSPLKVKDIPMMTTCEQEVYYDFVDNMLTEIKTADGLIINTFEDLEHQALAEIQQEFPMPIFPIGPFHKWFPTSNSTSLLSEDDTCISWLNTRSLKSVVYVSFGSTAAVSEAQFLEIASGLSNADKPFLWEVRPGLVHGSEWLEKLPQGYLEALKGKGHIVKWAPQKRVLAHPSVGLFWTHNGWNSTLEGICEGVPMICMPHFADQTVNARYACDVWRVGLQLEKGINRGEVEKTIRNLMEENEGEEIKCNMSKLKEKTNMSLQGGSSYQSLDGLVNRILSM